VTAEFRAGEGMFMTRNRAYFVPGSPVVDEFDALAVPNERDIAPRFRSGVFDILRTQDVATRDNLVAAVPEATLRTAPTQGSEWIIFEPASYESAKPPFNDQRVRQAVSMAIDRDAMLRTFYGGMGKVPGGVHVRELRTVVPGPAEPRIRRRQ
jgi:peptide/nickel transport system substrate-binding protein